MKRFIPLIADTLLAALCAFILFFTLVRYYHGAAAGLAAGICGGLAAGGAAYVYISLKQKKNDSAAAAGAGAAKLCTHLALLDPREAERLFASCLKGAEQKNGRIEDEKNAYFLHFAPEPADMDDLLEAARADTDKNKNKIFVCCAATQKCTEFAECAGIEIAAAGKLYKMFEDAGALPQKYLGERARVKFFARVKARFSKRICLPAFWSGATLMFFSYFTYYPIYYIAAGALMLALCAAAAIFGKSRKG